MRTATPLWKVLARAVGAVVLVFALVIGVLAVFGEDSTTQAASVHVKGASATRDTTAPTSTVPITAPPTTAAPEAAPTETAPPAPVSGGSSGPAAAPQAQAPAPTLDPNPPPPPPPPPPTNPPLNPRVRVSGAGGQLNVSLSGFAPNTGVSIACFGIDDQGKYFHVASTSTTTDGAGNGSAICSIPSGKAPFVFAEAGGAHSNHLPWS